MPAAAVVALLDDFAAIGTKRAIVICAGFRETGDAGWRLEERIKEICAASGMRLLGSNCMRIVNTAISLNITVATLENRPGHLGLASRSGTYVTQTLAYPIRCRRGGLPHRNLQRQVDAARIGDIDNPVIPATFPGGNLAITYFV